MTIDSVSNLYFTSEENRGIIMIKSLILRMFVSLPLLFAVVNAQEGVDAIEKARQAKEAADKAAAEAAAATEAAIEAAASKAAKEARADAKKKKEEEEARKIAEAQAAEEAELDAAASAAAEEAKRKMAAELGLEINDPKLDNTVSENTVAESEAVEDVVAKESSGFSFGVAPSYGAVTGETFVSAPVGFTLVIGTPLGFAVGPFQYNVSLVYGSYNSEYQSVTADGSQIETADLATPVVGLGGNLTLFDAVFAEGHVGTVGEGTGFRGFAGISLDRLMKKGLNLPVNVLLGSELFYSTDMAGAGNSSGWVSLGARLDYNF
jgi:hypothetical protein